MSDSGYQDGPWTDWNGPDWGSSTVEADPAEQLRRLSAVLLERTDQRDALKKRLDEIRAELVKATQDGHVSGYRRGLATRLIRLVDAELVAE